MPNNSFAQKLFRLQGFQNKYIPLLMESVAQQFSLANKGALSTSDMDIRYLLTCASILAQSNNGECQDAALRIAQYVLTTHQQNKEFREAAVIVLDTMTNYAAISLAKERKYIEPNMQKDYPVPLMMDMLKRQFHHSLWNENNNRLVPINRFQEKVFCEYLSFDALSISAPTSSGKSFILLQIILDYIKVHKDAIIVYIVPTRALIQQVTADINEILKNNSIVDVVVSSVPTVIIENGSHHIYVLTQERLHWILEDNASFSPNCLIVDEAQKIGDGSRGVILQQAIEEISRRNQNTKILFASPMTENPEILLDLLSADIHKGNLSSDQITVNQNLLWVNCSNEKDRIWNMQLCLGDATFELGKFRTEYRATSTSKRLPFIAHALSDPNGGNLIYANGAAEAEKVARILYDLQIKDVDDEQLNELIKLVKKTIHVRYDLVTALKRRIAFHYGNMPLIIKNEIEKLFKAGCIKYLVCTSTLMEGVNLPAKSIFVRAPQKGRNIPMNAVDFWNLAGRAGRQGKEFQGNIICIDTNNHDLWAGTLYRTKTKYPINSSVESVLKNKGHEIIQYISNDLTGDLSRRNPLYEHAITYVMDEYTRNNGLMGAKISSFLPAEMLNGFQNAIKSMLENIEIPNDILLRHQGISPVAQQTLLNYFKGYSKDLQQLIPLMPEDSNAIDNYNKVISRIQKHIEGAPFSKYNFYKAMLVVKWMRGYTLARIISENEKFYNSEKSKIKKKLPAIIRETMRDIEEYVRFLFVKQSACYVDILSYYLSSINSELVNQVPSLNIWLEFGASQDTQIALMNLGLSRTSAIALSEYIAADNYDMKKCIEWIKATDIELLDLSLIIKEEIKQIISTSYMN